MTDVHARATRRWLDLGYVALATVAIAVVLPPLGAYMGEGLAILVSLVVTP